MRELKSLMKISIKAEHKTWNEKPSGPLKVVTHVAVTNDFGGCTCIEAMLEKVGNIPHINLPLILRSRTAS